MTKLTNEDKALFAEATSDVGLLKTKVIISKKKMKKQPLAKLAKRKFKQSTPPEINYQNHFFNNDISLVSAHQTLFFQQPSIRKQDITTLKKGLFHIEITEDLHGKTEQAAEIAIHTFLHEAVHYQCKYGLLVHGKGYNSDSEKPILKNLVNQLLTSHPNILAFCSAKPKDGGTGAVYILFKTI